MPDANEGTCPRCNAPLPAGEPAGICPWCGTTDRRAEQTENPPDGASPSAPVRRKQKLKSLLTGICAIVLVGFWLIDRSNPWGRKLSVADTLNNRGIELRRQGKVDQAIAVYREAIQINPDLAEAHFNLGNILFAQGDNEEAIAEYRQAIRAKPDLAGAHFSLGNILLAQGNADEAIAEYHQAIRAKPDLALAHANLGARASVAGKAGRGNR